jgi:hypothetical protein
MSEKAQTQHTGLWLVSTQVSLSRRQATAGQPVRTSARAVPLDAVCPCLTPSGKLELSPFYRAWLSGLPIIDRRCLDFALQEAAWISGRTRYSSRLADNRVRVA